jgi:hypothetical protein
MLKSRQRQRQAVFDFFLLVWLANSVYMAV